MSKSSIKENLFEVKKIINESYSKSKYGDKEPILVAVSKTKSNDMIMEAYNEGIRDFGENYVQELSDKMKKLPQDIRWHMIGHLQTNKIKYIIDNVYMIHSVDSVHLAEAINKEAAKRNITVKVLLEVNIAKEESKFGFTVENIYEGIEQINKLDNINVLGLMTSAPYVEDMEDNRQYFVQLRELLVDLKNKKLYNNIEYWLSMGMTGDYPVAVEEGAGFVRVGTGIFGARNYN